MFWLLFSWIYTKCWLQKGHKSIIKVVYTTASIKTNLSLCFTEDRKSRDLERKNDFMSEQFL